MRPVSMNFSTHDLHILELWCREENTIWHQQVLTLMRAYRSQTDALKRLKRRLRRLEATHGDYKIY